MKYLFDTNIISDLYDISTKQHLAIIERLNTRNYLGQPEVII